jgi:hypothetical protein
MVVAKRTSKNQLTLPKAVVEQAGVADYYDVVCYNGRIVLTPQHPAEQRPCASAWRSWTSTRPMWPMLWPGLALCEICTSPRSARHQRVGVGSVV